MSVLSALPIDPHEVEEHLLATNDFFQQTLLSADDLHVYASALAPAVATIMKTAENSLSDAEIVQVIQQAAREYRRIDDAIEAENA